MAVVTIVFVTTFWLGIDHVSVTHSVPDVDENECDQTHQTRQILQQCQAKEVTNAEALEV